MGLSSKVVTLISALVGCAIFSQAPELTQQYRQRIGGAVDELKTVVADFDKDAAGSAMSRNEALSALVGSSEKFVHERGLSMERTVERFSRLKKQQQSIENANPFLRPLVVMKSPDTQIFLNAWEIFQPAIPLNSAGALYGGSGAFIAWLLARTGIAGVRKRRRRRSDVALKNAMVEAPSEIEKRVVEASTKLGDAE